MKSDAQGQYLLLDGTFAAPGDCKKGDDGVWRHANGVGVAVDGEGNPMTLAAYTESNKNKEAAEAGKEPVEEAPAPVEAPVEAPVATRAAARTESKPADDKKVD